MVFLRLPRIKTGRRFDARDRFSLHTVLFRQRYISRLIGAAKILAGAPVDLGLIGESKGLSAAPSIARRKSDDGISRNFGHYQNVRQELSDLASGIRAKRCTRSTSPGSWTNWRMTPSFSCDWARRRLGARYLTMNGKRRLLGRSITARWPMLASGIGANRVPGRQVVTFFRNGGLSIMLVTAVAAPAQVP